MSFKQIHEMEASPDECLRELKTALKHLDYELNADQIVFHDQQRQLVINLIYEGERHLGSLELPMTQLNYEFIGYTKQEMEELMASISRHLLRMGG